MGGLPRDPHAAPLEHGAVWAASALGKGAAEVAVAVDKVPVVAVE